MARPETARNIYYPHRGNLREKELFERVWEVQQSIPGQISIDYCRKSNGSLTLLFIVFINHGYFMEFYNTTNLIAEDAITFINNKINTRNTV